MSNLHKHMEINHGKVKITPKIAEVLKPFKCDMCNLSFEVSEWKKHISSDDHKKKNVFLNTKKILRKRKISLEKSSKKQKSIRSENSKGNFESVDGLKRHTRSEIEETYKFFQVPSTPLGLRPVSVRVKTHFG